MEAYPAMDSEELIRKAIDISDSITGFTNEEQEQVIEIIKSLVTEVRRLQELVTEAKQFNHYTD
jgi:hypothetical protein